MTTTESEPTAAPQAPGTLELWPDSAALRRSRALGGLLLVNWLVMGYFVVTQGLRSLVGGGAFLLGLMALIGGVSQLRGSRLAQRLPMVRLADGVLSFRRFTSAEADTLTLSQAEGITTASRDQIVIARRDGEAVQVPTLALAEADRDRLENALRARLER